VRDDYIAPYFETASWGGPDEKPFLTFEFLYRSRGEQR
jgi:hypothetical protein